MKFFRRVFQRKRRVGLCLNSSFFGFYAHAGFLDGFLSLGEKPAAVAGASAGALVAGLYAAGLPPARILELASRPDMARVFQERGAWLRLITTLGAFTGRTGVIRGERALAMLHESVGALQIEDCETPLSISVANISRGASEIVDRGPLAEYILASCAVPGMFAARQIDDSHYWDGGVADPVPFEQWIDDPEIDVIVVHMVLNPDELPERARGRLHFWSGLGRSYSIVRDEILRLKAELARRAGKELALYVTVAPRPSPWKLDLGRRCAELGRATALRGPARVIRAGDDSKS